MLHLFGGSYSIYAFHHSIDDQSLEIFLRWKKVVLVSFDVKLEVEGGIDYDSQVVEFWVMRWLSNHQHLLLDWMSSYWWVMKEERAEGSAGGGKDRRRRKNRGIHQKCKYISVCACYDFLSWRCTSKTKGVRGQCPTIEWAAWVDIQREREREAQNYRWRLLLIWNTNWENVWVVNNVFCFIGNVGYGTLRPILGLLFAKDKPWKVLIVPMPLQLQIYK